MKILNFGSLNIDWVYNVDHFVKPGETLSAISVERFCGGKGLNQSVALSKAGASVFHAGGIGSDGVFLKERLEESHVDARFVKELEVPTGNAFIQVDKTGQNCIILFGGANQEITKDYAEEVIKNFERGDILVLQNEISALNEIVDMAYERGMQIVLNPSPMNEKVLALDLEKITYFIMNEIEGEAITGNKNPEEILDSMIKQYPHSKVILTLGDKGSRYAEGAVRLACGSYEVEVVDTTSAGDTFTGYFISALAEKMEISRALERASKAAALAVSVKGASNSIPLPEQVDSCKLILKK
ncbi:ribokinase [Aminipila luticellarii]|uniref:Ribokinase n=1 Tax=Aminipila luticellarii TaxID=2507160 RepID=A0A410PS62_9FIRM|nr:ribokinase [Aminipila luticellarii]QAT41760.1 ribokinase [Aminipila luticellarii]